MLITLYGADSFRRARKFREIIAEYEKKHSEPNIRHFDLEEKNSFEGLKDFCAAQSLFDSSKLAVIHNLAEGKELKEFLKLFLENKNTTLIIVLDKKPLKAFDFLLKKPALSEEFEPLKGMAFAEFIKKESEARGLKPTLELTDYLIKISEGDSWSAITELEKISLGAKPEKIIQPPEFFPLIQKIKSRGEVSYKLTALTYLLENEDPAAVFNITASIADPEMKRKMADYDVAIKSGKLDYEEALTDLVIRD